MAGTGYATLRESRILPAVILKLEIPFAIRLLDSSSGQEHAEIDSELLALLTGPVYAHRL